MLESLRALVDAIGIGLHSNLREFTDFDEFDPLYDFKDFPLSIPNFALLLVYLPKA